MIGWKEIGMVLDIIGLNWLDGIITEMDVLIMFVKDDSVLSESFNMLTCLSVDVDLRVTKSFDMIIIPSRSDDKVDYFIDIIHSLK